MLKQTNGHVHAKRQKAGNKNNLTVEEIQL